MAKYKSLKQKYGHNIEIPTNYEPDAIQVFDHTGVHINVFRFVTYMLWLEQQSNAFEKIFEHDNQSSRPVSQVHL